MRAKKKTLVKLSRKGKGRDERGQQGSQEDKGIEQGQEEEGLQRAKVTEQGKGGE